MGNITIYQVAVIRQIRYQ